MKGFFEWFKRNTKMKRWIILILLGLGLVCLGLTEILSEKELATISDFARIIVSFVVGFTFTIIGMIFALRRNLEILLESGNKDKVHVKSLVFNRKVYDSGQNIVVIGGGNGILPVLYGLKKYTSNITAIVPISEYNEEIKNAIIALSEDEVIVEKLLNHRFDIERLKGISFGDIYLCAMEEIYKNIPESVSRSNEVLNMTGRVLPVTLDKMKIAVELEDGTVTSDKNELKEISSNRITKVKKVYVSPTNCRVSDGVLEAISKADAIVIGPGSLYTNIIPNFLIKNVAKAVKESTATKIYVSNIMTELGETDNLSLSEHIDILTENAGSGIIDYCIVDTGDIVPEFVRKYNEEGSEIVEKDFDKIQNKKIKIIQNDLSEVKGEQIRHNPDLLAMNIIKLICDDMKFKNQHNETKFLISKSILRDEKKKYRKRLKKPSRKKQVTKSGKSKFSEKYNERVNSIKNTAKTKEENMKKIDIE